MDRWHSIRSGLLAWLGSSLIGRIWTRLCRTRAWRWLRRGLVWGLVLLLVVDAAGVVLTAEPIAVEWKPVITTGFPPGSPLSVQALTVGPDGKSLFAGTWGRGVFRSDDGGQSWQPVNQGLTDLFVWTLAEGPVGLGGRTLFAGTSGGGVFRFDDEGQSWQPVSQGLTTLDVRALAVWPDWERLFAGTSDGVFRSDDGGTSWQAVNLGPTGLTVPALAVGPDGKSFFVGTSSGIFRFIDGGMFRRSVNQGLTKLDVRALAVGPAGKDLFAGTSDGVFRSADEGNSWQPVNQGLTNLGVSALTVGPDGRGFFAGTSGSGVFHFDDEGQSWQSVNQGLTRLDVQALAVGPAGRDLFAGTSGGVFRSADEGNSWQPVNQGLTKLDVLALAVGRDGEGLFAGTSGGVFRLDDGGTSWQPINQGLTNLDVQALAVGPDGKGLFAGTSGGVFRFDDGGEFWQSVNQGLSNLSVLTLLAVGADRESLFAGTSGGGVFRSDDGGDSWRTVNQGLTSLIVPALAIRPDGKSLFAGTSGGIFRSDDGGGSWKPVNQGLTEPGVQALAMGPNGESLFAGTSGGGVFRSDDGGDSWRSINQGLTSLNVPALAVGPDRLVFAGTDGGVFLLDNEANSWRSVSQELTSLNVPALAVGSDGERLFAGTSGGVFHSDDRGTSWQSINKGLSNLSVLELAVGSDRRVLLAKTPIGVFRSEDDTGRTWQAISGTFEEVGAIPLPTKVQWLRWATYQAPQAIVTRDSHATIYASAGAAMILRAEVSLPLIWYAPAPYLALVATTWQAIHWIRPNVVPLSIGLGLVALATLLYVYARVARPNRLRPATVLWLLLRPRHLRAAFAYQDYAGRWEAVAPLERLILLQASTDVPFTPDQLEAALRRLDAAFDSEGLQAALSALAQRELLVQEDGSWWLAEPQLAQVQRRELPRDEPDHLARRTRQEHALYIETRRFLTQAGFSVQPADPFGLLCTSNLPLWADYSPLYVRLVLERALDLEEFQALCTAAETVFGGELRRHTAAIAIDRPPREGDLHQIFALRGQRGLTIVPLPSSLMIQARLDEREMEALREQVELYTGRTNLYDVRATVTDVLSFFGRSTLLADLQRRLTSGQSAAVFGMRKVGKSSLLGRLREESSWPVALVDVEGYVRRLGYVYREALRTWRAALQTISPGLALPASMDDLTASDPTAQAQDFRQAVVDLLDFLANRPGLPGLLLFLDEIEYLLSQPEYMEFAGVLRSVAEDPRCRGRFALLVAGLEPTLNRVDRMDGGRNPFYAFFGEVPLGPLEPKDTRTMVVSIGGLMGISYEGAALDLLVEAGGGHPFLTRQLCSQVTQDLERPGTVDAAQATQAIEEYLRRPRNYLAESLWGVDSGGPPPTEATLLQALAVAQPEPEESLIPPDLSPGERRARQLALDHLHDQSLIHRVEGEWKLTIPLYRRWIRRYILDLPDQSTAEGER